MNNESDRGLFFSNEMMDGIRKKFYRIDTDADGSPRLFFENAGGSLRLRSTVEISDELNKYPDCYARDHKSSLVLQQYQAKGLEDVRTLLNAKSGTIATNLTASAAMFDMVEPMVEHGKGTNIVTTVLEHPSAFDSCRYFGKKYGKEVRVADSDKRTGGIRTEDVLKLVDKDTTLVNVIAASNMTGAITDIRTIAREAKKINPDVFVVTDAVQHAPHGVIDVEDWCVDGLNIAPYKFFGIRGISFAYISDRAMNLPHRGIIDDAPSAWELGSIAPAQYAAMSQVVDYVAWVGSFYNNSADKRELVEEGMKRIKLQEQALLDRLLHGGAGVEGLQYMEEVETFFDYQDLSSRDLILAMRIKGMDYTRTVREYEKRGIIVFERVATSAFSKRMVESFGLDGIIRVSPLHCNTAEEVDQFLRTTKDIIKCK